MVQDGPGGARTSDIPDGRRRADDDRGRDLDAGGLEPSCRAAVSMLAARVEKLSEVRVGDLSSGLTYGESGVGDGIAIRRFHVVRKNYAAPSPAPQVSCGAGIGAA